VPTPRLFSFDKFNVLSIRTSDYIKHARSFHEYIEDVIDQNKIAKRGQWTAELITHPRIFGYSFNPISYWVISDIAGRCIAVLCAVNNTFRQSHNYLVAHPNARPILPDDTLKARKELYVSPFNAMDGYYEFTFLNSSTEFLSTVNLFTNNLLTLETYMHGTKQHLNSSDILRLLYQYPLMTAMVTARIHLNAVKLLLKGLRFTIKKSKPKDYVNDRTSKSD
jgi:DUF1365 family protein